MSADALPIGEDDLTAWVDRRLDAARLAEVERYLDAHPDVAARLTRQRETDAALTEALRPTLEAPMPTRLRVAPMLAAARRRRMEWAGRIAATVLLCLASGAAGWALHAPAAEPLQSAASNARAAFLTYTPEIRHPVEVRAEQGEHLAQWLSTRLGRPIRPPDLSTLGWRLMGGRVLATAAIPAALLMYDDDRGTRLTVYVQPMGVDGQDFRYVRQGDVGMVLWAEPDMALAVTGRASRQVLTGVAERVRDATIATE